MAEHVIRLDDHRPQQDECLENIAADIAILPDGENIAITGAGSVDIYPGLNHLGLTVTASTGLSLYVSIPVDAAQAVLAWALHMLRGGPQ